MATDEADLAAKIQELRDRQEITDLVHRLHLYADRKDFDQLEDVFVADVGAGFRNNEVALQGLETLRERGRKSLEPFERVQHANANILIDLDGDTAKVRANVLATHVYQADDPSRHWVVKAYYNFEMVRTAAGWRIARTGEPRIWEYDTDAPDQLQRAT